MRAKILFFVFLLVSSRHIHGQNSDLIINHFSGKYRGMANAGIAAATGTAAIALNPAGLAHSHRFSLSVAMSGANNRYALFRQNVGSWAFDEEWSASRFRFDNLSGVLQFGERFNIGVGFFRKIDPFTDNDRRAITGSSLFHQTTSGGIQTLAVGSSVKLSERFSAGVALHYNNGTITSEIRGDNHGRETDKWAELKSESDGMNFQGGLVFTTDKMSMGVTVSTAADLEVAASTRISANRDYAPLFPPYAQATWKLPWVVGVGLVYTGFKDAILTVDVETQRFKDSDVQLNLYEFGGRPHWRTVNIVRAGIEFVPSKRWNLPIRFGYAYTPQLYDSNHSVGEQNVVEDYTNAEQNVKHLITTGTTVTFVNFSCHLGFAYSVLQWHRRWDGSFLLLDDYTEKTYGLFGELVYHWR